MTLLQDSARKVERLQALARGAMLAHGLLPDFPPEVIASLNSIPGPARPPENEAVRDLRDLAWCSVDNETSKDLDQLTAAEPLPSGATRILVALADVDALVPKDSPIDLHAAKNTASIYTPAKIFPMIPERLSTDLSSLNYAEDRLALLVEFEVASDASLTYQRVSRALVRNKAKLAYGSVGLWLDGKAPLPPGIEGVPGLAESLQLQARVALALKKLRHANGALDLESPELRPAIADGRVYYPGASRGNPAKLLIEDFMIAANGSGARFLASKGFSSIRRVVRTPKRWDRIVELARACNARLPETPDPKALERFLESARVFGPEAFQELCFSVMKLLGPGEYVVETPDRPSQGHFGLAVKDYTHSTAPNRRYADLVTHRLLKAALAGRQTPYAVERLSAIASRCTAMENAAKKLERQLNKSAVAMILEDRIGDEFDAIVTGASEKGVWVKIFDPPVEGRLAYGYDNLDVGDKIHVRLVHTDASLGHIDFKRMRR